MKIRVDMDACDGHAQCVFAAPNVFELDGKGKVNYIAEPDESERERVMAAADACPLLAIEIIE
ncbi:ferredoxin [Arthrobacter sp. I2-34]|uniref:Ferredoxin n=1 Tax=Arthrobacter hankyongi TaxID=2904801 RepID=A0ABS9L345_9MICC|nr:ferredoxin [Arthrobacter hankyongi]MCG2621117.1 ferredoxin [Arthrobacter hankyongi]